MQEVGAIDQTVIATQPFLLIYFYNKTFAKLSSSTGGSISFTVDAGVLLVKIDDINAVAYAPGQWLSVGQPPV